MARTVVRRWDQDRSLSLAASAEEVRVVDPVAEDPMAVVSWARLAVVSWARFASVHQLLLALNVDAALLDLKAMKPALKTLLLEVVGA